MLLHLKKRFSQKDEHWRWSWREVGLKCKSGEIWPPPAAEEILAPLCREIHLRFPLGNPHFLSIEVGSFMKIVLSPWRTFMYTAFPQLRQHFLKGRKLSAPWWFLLLPRLKCISKSWWSINKILNIDWNIAIICIEEEIKKGTKMWRLFVFVEVQLTWNGSYAGPDHGTLGGCNADQRTSHPPMVTRHTKYKRCYS